MKTAATLARIAFEASVQDAGPIASRAVAEAAAAYRLSFPAARLAALDAELGRQELAGHIGSWAEPASPAPRPAPASASGRQGRGRRGQALWFDILPAVNDGNSMERYSSRAQHKEGRAPVLVSGIARSAR